VGVVSVGAEGDGTGDGGIDRPTFWSAVREGSGSYFSDTGLVSERVGFVLSTVVDA
jgi:hypothetical protein